MKILMVNKYFYVKGGSERYYFNLKELLESHGHQIIPFAMTDERNVVTPFNHYFVDQVDYNGHFRLKSIRDAVRLLYSFHARKKIDALIEETRPDIAHLHMIDHQISPSILHSLRKFRIPAIQTVHQYKLICPNYLCYNERDSKICNKCFTGKYYHAILERCHKNSLIASTLIACEAYLNQFFKIYKNNIELFHAPSIFMKKMLTHNGVNEGKIEQHYYVTWLDQFPFSPHYEDYFVYLGRLSPEKGIHTLLKAMTEVKRSKLVIIGDGPQRSTLEQFTRENRIENVKFLGYKAKEEVKDILRHASFTIIPSECYDNSPLAIYESFSMGKPVVGATIGGITELIDPGEDGLLFGAGKYKELANSINKLLDRRDKIPEMGIAARSKAEKYFNPDEHYHWISAQYAQVIERYHRSVIMRD